MADEAMIDPTEKPSTMLRFVGSDTEVSGEYEIAIPMQRVIEIYRVTEHTIDKHPSKIGCVYVRVDSGYGSDLYFVEEPSFDALVERYERWASR